MKTMDKHWEQLFFALLVLAIAFLVGRILRYILGRFLKVSARKLKVDPTRYNFFKNAVDFIIFLIAAIVIFRSIPSLHYFGTTLITGAGVLAAIVGFASQSAFSNIVSGIFLVIVLKAIKEKFSEEHVEVAYPYKILIQKSIS